MPNKCPQCASEHGYQDRNFWICPECGHEWDPSSNSQAAADATAFTVRDAYGQVLPIRRSNAPGAFRVAV